jgi:hypothetical protein
MSEKSVANIQIDQTHCRAICDEIGDRLREILRRKTAGPSPRLQYLLERLAESDGDFAPSVVPSIEDMTIIPNDADAPAYAEIANYIAVNIR